MIRAFSGIHRLSLIQPRRKQTAAETWLRRRQGEAGSFEREVGPPTTRVSDALPGRPSTLYGRAVSIVARRFAGDALAEDCSAIRCRCRLEPVDMLAIRRSRIDRFDLFDVTVPMPCGSPKRNDQRGEVCSRRVRGLFAAGDPGDEMPSRRCRDGGCYRSRAKRRSVAPHQADQLALQPSPGQDRRCAVS